MLELEMFGIKLQLVQTTKLGSMPEIYFINIIEGVGHKQDNPFGDSVAANIFSFS